MADQRPRDDDVTQPAGPVGNVRREAELIDRARADAAAAPDSSDRLRNAPKIDGYEFVRELHRGGQGVVYQALEKATKRKVAIKVLLEGPYASDHARRRFEREIELAASLKHPNIVPVFHSGITPDSRQFCVMDYVRGVPLHQYVRDQKLALEDALKLFTKVCEAVNYAHQKGIIHRDLKPSNVLVDSDGSPKVLDFGLAKLVGGPEQTLVSMTGQVVGTLPYLSPEQARGNPDEIDIRTDVYSLGVVLYEMLTGQFPYPVIGQMVDVLRHIASTEPTPPSRTWKPESGVTQRNSGRRSKLGSCPIDDEVQTIVLRSLTKERQRRYQSAAELGKDVERYLRKEPIEAKKDSTFYVLGKQLRRYRAQAAFAATLVLLLVGFAVSMGVMANREHNAKSEAIGARDESRKAAEAEQLARAEADRLALEAKKGQEAAESEAYASNIAAVNASIELDEPRRVEELLRKCQIPRRGWEWYYLKAKSDVSIAHFHLSQNAHVVQISPDNSRVVLTAGNPDWSFGSGEDENRFSLGVIRDLRTGSKLAELNGHQSWISAISFSRDGKKLVTTSNDKTARLWDAMSGRRLAELRGHEGRVSSALFSPNGTQVLTSSLDATVRVWEAESGKELHRFDGNRGQDFVGLFNVDGTLIVTASRDGMPRLWSADTGKEVRTLEKKWTDDRPSDYPPGTIAYQIRSPWLTFSPNGEQVLMAMGKRGVRLWSTETGKEIAVIRDEARAAFFAEEDGFQILTVSGIDATVEVFDSLSEQRSKISNRDYYVSNVDFCPDISRVITTSYDSTPRIWDLPGEYNIALRGHTDSVSACQVLRDCRLIFTTSLDNTARLWDAEIRNDLIEASGEGVAKAAVLTDSGVNVASVSDGKVSIWNSKSARIVATIATSGDHVNLVGFCSNGKRLITWSEKSIEVWNNDTFDRVYESREVISDTGGTSVLGFNSTGTRIVTAERGIVTVWDVVGGKRLIALRHKVDRDGNEATFESASFSHNDDRLVTVCDDNTAHIWDVSSGRELVIIEADNLCIGPPPAFTLDGKRVAFANDNSAQIYDSQSGKEVISLGTHEAMLTSLCYSPDGRRILSASEDNMVRLWDAETGKELLVLRGPGSVASFSTDGTMIVAGDNYQYRIWDSVPYRVRFDERRRRERGEPYVNQGLQYMKEMRGEAAQTWLSRPCLEINQPDSGPVCRQQVSIHSG